MRRMLIGLIGLVLLGVATIAGMIAFGTSDPPPPLASINGVFEKVDFSDLPGIEKTPVRGGGTIAYRHWDAQPVSAGETLIVAIHGSAGSSTGRGSILKCRPSAEAAYPMRDVPCASRARNNNTVFPSTIAAAGLNAPASIHGGAAGLSTGRSLSLSA